MVEELAPKEDSVSPQEEDGQEGQTPNLSLLKSDARLWGMELGILCAFLIALSSIAVLWNLQDTSLRNMNTASRYGTIEALVDHGNFYLDDTQYVFSIDKIKPNGHFVSSKPPLLPLYGAGIYWTYQKITGRTIRGYENEVVWLVGLGTGWLFHVLFLIYVYRFALLICRRPSTVVLSVIIAGFAYLGTGYATAINNHSIGASLAWMLFYYAYRLRHGLGVGTRHWIVASLLVSVLPLIDLPFALFSFAILVYVAQRSPKKALIYFSSGLLIALLIQEYLSLKSTGSLIPAYMNREAKDFAESFFRQKNLGGIEGLKEPKWLYILNLTFGHHGLFVMTPFYILSVYEMYRQLRRREKYWVEILVIAIPSLLTVAFYVKTTANYGGWCVGARWFVPMMGLLLWPLFLAVDRINWNRFKVSFFAVVLFWSAFHVQDALGSPFQFSRWHNLLERAPNRNRVADMQHIGAEAARLQRERNRAAALAQRQQEAEERRLKQEKKKKKKKKESAK